MDKSAEILPLSRAISGQIFLSHFTHFPCVYSGFRASPAPDPSLLSRQLPEEPLCPAEKSGKALTERPTVSFEPVHDADSDKGDGLTDGFLPQSLNPLLFSPESLLKMIGQVVKALTRKDDFYILCARLAEVNPSCNH